MNSRAACDFLFIFSPLCYYDYSNLVFIVPYAVFDKLVFLSVYLMIISPLNVSFVTPLLHPVKTKVDWSSLVKVWLNVFEQVPISTLSMMTVLPYPFWKTIVDWLGSILELMHVNPVSMRHFSGRNFSGLKTPK